MWLVASYILTIPAANWLIQHVGTVCVANGPCLIPVAPNIMAPSGVLLIGIALLLRDFVQRQYGAPWSLACIAAGTVLSVLIKPSLQGGTGMKVLGVRQEDARCGCHLTQVLSDDDGLALIASLYQPVRGHFGGCTLGDAKAR